MMRFIPFLQCCCDRPHLPNLLRDRQVIVLCILSGEPFVFLCNRLCSSEQDRREDAIGGGSCCALEAHETLS